MCGISVNTYSKYLHESITKGFITVDGMGNFHFACYKTLFRHVFADKGDFIHVSRGDSFQEYKEAIRAAILLANYREQDFIITGDRTQGGRRRTKREAYAHSWAVKNRSTYAPKHDKILTSNRQAGKTFGMSLGTGGKTIKRLLKEGYIGFVNACTRIFFKGSTQAKISFAEENRPFPGCSYHLSREHVIYHTGRQVILRDRVSSL